MPPVHTVTPLNPASTMPSSAVVMLAFDNLFTSFHDDAVNVRNTSPCWSSTFLPDTLFGIKIGTSSTIKMLVPIYSAPDVVMSSPPPAAILITTAACADDQSAAVPGLTSVHVTDVDVEPVR